MEEFYAQAEWSDDGLVKYWFAEGDQYVDMATVIRDACIKDNDASRIECYVDDRLDAVYLHLGGGYWEAWR
jgi:hypothetical protein